ncbi:hypothetical protein N9V00_00545 [Bacteroidota bacterium]|nr:hypothetical protein [Bacteroidota bacterium]
MSISYIDGSVTISIDNNLVDCPDGEYPLFFCENDDSAKSNLKVRVQNNLFDLHAAIAAHQEFLRTEAIPDNHIFFEGLLYLTDKKRLMILTGS